MEHERMIGGTSDGNHVLLRNMTREQLQAVLQEAIAAGVAARQAETQALLQKAREAGRRDEDQCGWSWLDIDAAGYQQLKHLATGKNRAGYYKCERLDIPGGSIEFDPERLYPYRLYLTEVSSYQHIYASLAGLTAAAGVLAKYGITAEQHGYLD
jgi:hypothetical protein